MRAGSGEAVASVGISEGEAIEIGRNEAREILWVLRQLNIYRCFILQEGS